MHYSGFLTASPLKRLAFLCVFKIQHNVRGKMFFDEKSLSDLNRFMFHFENAV